MKNTPRSIKIIVLIQVIIVLIIRMNFGFAAELWSVVPVILLGLGASFLIKRVVSKTIQ